MTGIKELDIIKEKIPLKGVSLVEAGAGTGKTFSITKIILEAILSGIKIDKILVVTFTEAATKELRGRIRTELYDYKKYIHSSQNEKNLFFDAINAFFPEKEHNRKKICEALLNIDRAQIFTIHAFCRKILTENAFESGQAFECQLITDSEEILKEIAEDFWREKFVDLSPLAMKLVKKITPEQILDIVKDFMRNGDRKFVNMLDCSFSEMIEKCCEILLNSEKELKKYDLFQVQETLMNYFEKYCENLNKPFGFKYFQETISKAVHKLQNDIYDIDALKIFNFQYVESCRSKKALKKNFELKNDPIFDIGNNIHQVYDLLKKISNILVKELFEYTSRKLKNYKISRNIQTFDDLITNLHKTLELEKNLKSKPLTELIRYKYDLAIVDEFQDTDTKQYAIFQAIFNFDNKGFFMIGDPKQSIYKFRGADVFSYITAKNQAKNHYTLFKNFRSEGKVVNAVNSLFSFKKHLFDSMEKEEAKAFTDNPESTDIFVYGNRENFEGINFVKAEPGLNENSQKKLILNDEKNNPGMIISMIETEDQAFNLQAAASYTASETSRLLNLDMDKAYILLPDGKKKQLNPEDFAVLVNTHKQAALVKEAMTVREIPAVIQNTAKIFESQEAEDIKNWIKAVISPSESNIKKLFVSNLMNKTFDQINALSSEQFMQITEYFSRISKFWSKNGFFSSFSFFMEKFDLVANTIKLQNGKRIITNYFQIRELLHQYELRNIYSPERTLSYITEMIFNAPSGDDAIEELESDKAAVRIMTVHKSKGLEFPIVFCPYFWTPQIVKGEKKQLTVPFCEFENNIPKHKLDLGADQELFEKHKIYARKETLAELVRLLYVGVTRAAHRIYMPVIKHKLLKQSVLSYVFTKCDTSFLEDITKTKDCEISELTIKGLKNIQKFSNDTIVFEQGKTTLTKYFTKNEKVNYDKLCFEQIKPAKLERKWAVGSFSNLIALHKYERDSQEKGKEIFNLPSGKVFGTVVHKIFENYFTYGNKVFNEPTCRKYLFENILDHMDFFHNTSDEKRKERMIIAEKMFHNCLNVDINVLSSSFKLSQINYAVPEFTFCHKIKNFSPDLLESVFKKFPELYSDSFSNQVADLGFNLKNGYMNGEIDLFFKTEKNLYYVLDWKTNNLGASTECYSPDKIKENMEKHLYTLQAHIYSIATHIYLRTYLSGYEYNKNFGGYIYIYTRGADIKGNGVYFAKPPEQLINYISKEICGI